MKQQKPVYQIRERNKPIYKDLLADLIRYGTTSVRIRFDVRSKGIISYELTNMGLPNTELLKSDDVTLDFIQLMDITGDVVDNGRIFVDCVIRKGAVLLAGFQSSYQTFRRYPELDKNKTADSTTSHDKKHD